MENQEFVEEYEICTCPPKLGEKAPDFEVVTTQGKIKLSDYNKGSWVLLFSHPADFTPVCTTEFSGFAQRQEDFDKRNVKLIGLSVDSVYSHLAWIQEIEKIYDVKVKFPIIADLGQEVSLPYGMICPEVSDVHAVRTLFIIDPNGIVKFHVTYPMSVGRNMDEIIRIVDALQVVEKEKVSTPLNWQPGDSVIVAPPKTMDELEKRKHNDHDECQGWFFV